MKKIPLDGKGSFEYKPDKEAIELRKRKQEERKNNGKGKRS